MKILYWCPFINKVATIKAVTNSIIPLKKYSKKINPIIVDAVGEWSSKKIYLKSNNVELIKFTITNTTNRLEKIIY